MQRRRWWVEAAAAAAALPWQCGVGHELLRRKLPWLTFSLQHAHCIETARPTAHCILRAPVARCLLALSGNACAAAAPHLAVSLLRLRDEIAAANPAPPSQCPGCAPQRHPSRSRKTVRAGRWIQFHLEGVHCSPRC